MGTEAAEHGQEGCGLLLGEQGPQVAVDLGRHGRELAPALFAGGLFAFFASFDELVITYFISGAIETLPLRIWNDLNLRLDPTVAAVACLLILVSVIGMGGAEWLRRRTLPSQE